MAQTLRLGDIWTGTVAALRGRFWTLVWVAAPFTLMVEMTVSVFGPAPPAPPKTLPLTFDSYFALYPPALLLIRVALPLLVGGLAQLAVVRLIANPAEVPRTALASAVAGWPGYALAATLVMVALIGGASFFLLPGLYVWSRLFLCAPVAALESGSPLSFIGRSWRLTSGHGLTLFVALVLGLLLIFGVLAVVQIAGAAVGAILSAAGLGAASGFVILLFAASGEVIAWLGATAAAAAIYARLR